MFASFVFLAMRMCIDLLSWSVTGVLQYLVHSQIWGVNLTPECKKWTIRAWSHCTFFPNFKGGFCQCISMEMGWVAAIYRFL